MICLNCGYCCIMSTAIIVDPKSIKDQKRIEEFKKKDLIIKDHNIICPHLDLEDNVFKCKIHNLPWYKDTPCCTHTQIESRDTKCRMGKHVLSTNSIINLLEKYNEEKENGS